MGNPGQTKKTPIVRWFGLKHVAQIFYRHFFTKFGTKSAFLYCGWSKKSKIAHSKVWAILGKRKNTYCALVWSKTCCPHFLQALSQNLVLKVHFCTMVCRKNQKLYNLRDGQSWTNKKNTLCALVWSKTCCTHFLYALFHKIWY